MRSSLPAAQSSRSEHSWALDAAALLAPQSATQMSACFAGMRGRGKQQAWCRAGKP